MDAAYLFSAMEVKIPGDIYKPSPVCHPQWYNASTDSFKFGMLSVQSSHELGGEQICQHNSTCTGINSLSGCSTTLDQAHSSMLTSILLV